MNRRALIGGTLLFAAPKRLHANSTVDFKPTIPRESVDRYTAIDASELNVFYGNITDFLWSESHKLYFTQFQINCEMLHHYGPLEGEGYVVPVSDEAYPALILARADKKDFFIATNENPRSFRHFNTLRVQGYYRGGLMFSNTYESRSGDHSVVEVDALPLIAATEIVGL